MINGYDQNKALKDASCACQSQEEQLDPEGISRRHRPWTPLIQIVSALDPTWAGVQVGVAICIMADSVSAEDAGADL